MSDAVLSGIARTGDDAALRHEVERLTVRNAELTARYLVEPALRLSTMDVRRDAIDSVMTELARIVADEAGQPPLVCVPMLPRGAVVGALIVFDLLGHKAELEPADLELIELLQVHGGSALAATAPRGRQGVA